MDRTEQIRIAKRLLGFIRDATAEAALHQHRVDVDRYTDPALWEQEVEAFYKRSPIVAGLSCELPDPGSYKAEEIIGVPVLLVRDSEGQLNAFLSMSAVIAVRRSPPGAEGRRASPAPIMPGPMTAGAGLSESPMNRPSAPSIVTLTGSLDFPAPSVRG